MTTPCFLVKPSQRSRRRLRRYAHGATCISGLGYHNASTEIEGEFPYAWADDRERRLHESPVYDHADPRWPAKCEGCDYVFVAADEWQVFENEIYTNEAGKEYHLGSPEPGMMWLMPWMASPSRYDATRERHPDAYLSVHYYRDWATLRAPICVATPGTNAAQWIVDARSSNGDGWVVTGDAPLLSCSPSIVVPGYHGFLVNGVFSDAL